MSRAVLQIILCTPRLHIRMSFKQEEVGRSDREQKHSRTDKVGQKIRESTKHTIRRKPPRKVL